MKEKGKLRLCESIILSTLLCSAWLGPLKTVLKRKTKYRSPHMAMRH